MKQGNSWTWTLYTLKKSCIFSLVAFVFLNVHWMDMLHGLIWPLPAILPRPKQSSPCRQVFVNYHLSLTSTLRHFSPTTSIHFHSAHQALFYDNVVYYRWLLVLALYKLVITPLFLQRDITGPFCEMTSARESLSHKPTEQNWMFTLSLRKLPWAAHTARWGYSDKSIELYWAKKTAIADRTSKACKFVISMQIAVCSWVLASILLYF